MCSAGDGRATAGDRGPPAARHAAGAPLPARHLRDQVRAAGGVPHPGQPVPRGMSGWGVFVSVRQRYVLCFDGKQLRFCLIHLY